MLHAHLVSVFLRMQNDARQDVRASATQASPASPGLSAARLLTATIVSRLPDGAYLADLGGRPIQLALPVTAFPGQVLSLRVIRAKPDFVLELVSQSTPGRRPVAAAATATALSPGARVIQLALGDAPGIAADLTKGQSLLPQGTLRLATPLLPSAPQAPVSGEQLPALQLAAALRNFVDRSGLFYESHLAAWTQGQRTLAQIQREPQAQWGPQAQPAKPASAAPADGRDTAPAHSVTGTRLATIQSVPQHGPAAPPGSNLALAAAEKGARLPATHGLAQQGPEIPETRVPAQRSAGGEPARATPETLADEARPMLRQQLETLETRQIALQGPVWPGQHASLAITEESTRDGEASDQSAWRTTLRLALPQLGGLRAELVACADTVSVSIAAQTRDCAGLLNSALPVLEERLRAAGVHPLFLRVQNEGQGAQAGTAHG